MQYFRVWANVLLITDSLRRVARSASLGWLWENSQHLEVTLHQLFPLLPNLINGNKYQKLWSITAIAILADGDDTTSDPVVDTARAILDGHIVLSRELAQQGIYPAIDVNQSISRLMNDIVDPTQQKNAQLLRKYLLKYNENRDLVLMGGYVQGQDPDLDNALAIWPAIVKFLKQGESEVCRFDESISQLAELLGA